MKHNHLDITLHPKKTVHIFGLILCSLSILIAIVIGIIEGWSWPVYVFVGIFALTAPMSIVQLLPGNAYLHIDSEGFTICSLFRKTRIPWSAVDKFFVVPGGHRGAVGLNFVPSYASSYENPLGRSKILKVLANCDFALPDLYGRNAEDLVAFMNECLRSAISTDSIHKPVSEKP